MFLVEASLRASLVEELPEDTPEQTVHDQLVAWWREFRNQAHNADAMTLRRR